MSRIYTVCTICKSSRDSIYVFIRNLQEKSMLKLTQQHVLRGSTSFIAVRCWEGLFCRRHGGWLFQHIPHHPNLQDYKAGDPVPVQGPLWVVPCAACMARDGEVWEWRGRKQHGSHTVEQSPVGTARAWWNRTVFFSSSLFCDHQMQISPWFQSRSV